MKKLLIALLVIFVVLAAFVACGGDETPDSVPDSTPSSTPSSTPTSTPTSTPSSVSGGSDDCTHEYEVKSETAPTCTEKGVKVEVCKKCQREISTETAALGHDEKEEVIKPTCSEGGKTVYTCQREGCDHQREDFPTEADPKKHVYEVKTKPATCLEAGWTCEACTVCEQEKANSFMDLPALKHTYEREEPTGIVKVDPDCLNDGTITKTCLEEGCTSDPIVITVESLELEGKMQEAQELRALGHSFNTYDPDEDIVAPTCTTGGYTVYHCVNNNCEATENKDPKDALGHSYTKSGTEVEGVTYVITKEPTCIKNGEKVYKCTVCEELATEDEHKVVLDMIDHNIVDTDENYFVTGSALDATCTEKAKKTYKCNVDAECNKTEVFEYDAPIGHNWQVSGEQTCKTEGKTPYACANVCNGIACQETKLDDPVSDIRHTYGSVAKPATCCDRAVFKCQICEAEYTSYDDDVLGNPTGAHVYDVVYEVVGPKCDAIGYTVYSCSAGNCGKLDGDKEDSRRDIVARTDHTFTEATVDGIITCTVCSKAYRDVSAEYQNGSGKLCLGCQKDPCECVGGGLDVEWSGVVSPKAPEEIVKDTEYVKSEVKWTEVEESTKPLAIGEGMIVITSKNEESIIVTVKVYNTATGETELVTIEKAGVVILIDLYDYESVDKVSILSNGDATVAFYTIVK